MFQCSSASRKFLNSFIFKSSFLPYRFQCSSASRKFLNSYSCFTRSTSLKVSVLFSEPKIPQLRTIRCCVWRYFVSVLFSEPKIPQSNRNIQMVHCNFRVSVLFSEPKIPQWKPNHLLLQKLSGFSALQRAENSSIYATLFSSTLVLLVSVLFSEPKIPQYQEAATQILQITKFQCSSASRKFLNTDHWYCDKCGYTFQCSSASRKFLNLEAYATKRAVTTVSVLFSEPKIPQSW